MLNNFRKLGTNFLVSLSLKSSNGHSLHNREALSGTFTIKKSEALLVLNICPLHVQSFSILNVAGADALPVGVDSVFFNLCPAWGFFVWFCFVVFVGQGPWG